MISLTPRHAFGAIAALVSSLMSASLHAAAPADETIAAGAILCVYEFLDIPNTAWDRHLSGTKSLFDLADNEGMMPHQSPTSPGCSSQRLKPSRSRRAAFWNFARQDFLAACECHLAYKDAPTD